MRRGGCSSSDRLPLVEAYAALLADQGVLRGLLGPREVPRLWERHLLNCAGVADLLPTDATVCDVGSGAGLPGIVLAIARPGLHVTLVEPLLRRATFLSEVVAALGLATVEVVRARAEQLPPATFDVVTARAVAPLPRLLEWCWPLVAPGGALVALKGSTAHDEVASSDATLSRLGCPPPEVLRVQAGSVTTHVVRVTRSRDAAVGSRDARSPAGGGTR